MECLISFCDNGCSRVSSIYLNIKFQSPLPYGERRSRHFVMVIIFPVSIHAPIWGATYLLPCHSVDKPVSIHAPVWGATEWAGTGRRGHVTVSIHAPIWGATKVKECIK